MSSNDIRSVKATGMDQAVLFVTRSMTLIFVPLISSEIIKLIILWSDNIFFPNRHLPLVWKGPNSKEYTGFPRHFNNTPMISQRNTIFQMHSLFYTSSVLIICTSLGYPSSISYQQWRNNISWENSLLGGCDQFWVKHCPVLALVPINTLHQR